MVEKPQEMMHVIETRRFFFKIKLLETAGIFVERSPLQNDQLGV